MLVVLQQVYQAAGALGQAGYRLNCVMVNIFDINLILARGCMPLKQIWLQRVADSCLAQYQLIKGAKLWDNASQWAKNCVAR